MEVLTYSLTAFAFTVIFTFLGFLYVKGRLYVSAQVRAEEFTRCVFLSVFGAIIWPLSLILLVGAAVVFCVYCIGRAIFDQ